MMPSATEFVHLEQVYRCKDCYAPLPPNRRQHWVPPRNSVSLSNHTPGRWCPPRPVALGPEPPGYVRCAGDPACPFRLSYQVIRRNGPLCPQHRDIAAIRLHVLPGRRSEERRYDDLAKFMEEGR